jgi:hypothetical protein
MMRPPFGSVNNIVEEVAGELGQKIVTWNFDSQDSVPVPANESIALYTNLINSGISSFIALNHETYSTFPSFLPGGKKLNLAFGADTSVFVVLPAVLKLLQGKNYNLVTVAECLGMEPYLKVGEPQNVRLPLFAGFMICV